jgi:hypothetical protein
MTGGKAGVDTSGNMNVLSLCKTPHLTICSAFGGRRVPGQDRTKHKDRNASQRIDVLGCQVRKTKRLKACRCWSA